MCLSSRIQQPLDVSFTYNKIFFLIKKIAISELSRTFLCNRGRYSPWCFYCFFSSHFFLLFCTVRIFITFLSDLLIFDWVIFLTVIKVFNELTNLQQPLSARESTIRVPMIVEHSMHVPSPLLADIYLHWCVCIILTYVHFFIVTMRLRISFCIQNGWFLVLYSLPSF